MNDYRLALIKNIEPWKPIIPNGYDRFKSILDSYWGDREFIRILIADDIDTDGFGSAKICYEKLSRLFPNCSIHINNQHGFDFERTYTEDYDIVIIVDSSSSLVESYTDRQQIIILDHHEYDHSLICPPNVLLINSKDTPGLESISAGMLVYLVCTQYLQDRGIADWDNLFDVACMTLYSDLVPVDKYVQECLFHFMKNINNYSKLLTTLNIKHQPINHNTLAFNIIPLINYTRRLNDKATLQLLYKGKEEVAIRSMLENKSTGRYILEIFDTIGEIEVDYTNFTFCNISTAVDFLPQYPAGNFKGVFANKLADKHGKPAIVGFSKNEKTYVSVRSNEIDSLSYFIDKCISGGGHKPACGFEFYEYDVPSILKGYDKYLLTAEHEEDGVIEINDLSELGLFNLWILAALNEFRYSNFPPVLFRINNLKCTDIENIDNIRGAFSIGAYRFSTFDDIPTSGLFSMDIRPIMINYNLQTKILLAHIYR